jgi:histidyl-tRNA synthetase
MPRRRKFKIEEAKDKNSGERIKTQLKYSRLRGMKDILFDEYKYWDLVIKKASELAKIYSFKRVETPILEKSELYERSSGKTSDVVTKEMYSFLDKNGERVSLRPEATPSLARIYIEHGMINLPQPVKMFWLGPLFRHDKPQAGRYRQFHQYDLEIFGDPSPVADALMILVAYNFFRELQIGVQVQINSIGCKECRPVYVSKLLEFYKERGKRSKLCYDCKKRIIKNPLRLLDCKEEVCIKTREDAPHIVDSLCDSCRNHFVKVLEYLDELEVSYNLNPYLVRGLDYYNRTVFEFVATGDENNAPEEKAQMALCGGGRYDDLVEHMGGRPTPACGFGLGLERTIMIIKEKNIPLKRDDEVLIFLAQLGEQSRRKLIVLFEEMRRSGFKVRQAFTKDSLKAQLEEADRLGAKFSLILGQKELMDGTILLRDMESGIQEVIDYKKLKVELEKRLNEKNNPVNNINNK